MARYVTLTYVLAPVVLGDPIPDPKNGMTAPNPAWHEIAPMNYKRSYHTLTVLPDGKVLATGGENGTDGVDETKGVLGTEIWDPDTDTWSVCRRKE